MARPLNFDRTRVLKNAAMIFWHQGYQKTSMKDLESATGLLPSSLYNSFGNKETLFLEILDFYTDHILGGRIEKYLRQEDPLKGLQQFFITCFTDLPRGRKGMACLIVNSISEMAIHNEAIRKKLLRVENTLTSNFITNLDKAKQAGTIAKNIDSEIIANQLLISLNGLLVASKVIKDNVKMVAACEQSLQFILGNRSGNGNEH
ncbi:MAG: TetR/AcrR family transcriptional regulator [Bermanella sp.]